MRHLFYAMVEMITENITGIENGAMTLWELPIYLRVTEEVTEMCNVAIAIILMIPVIIIGITELYKFFNTLFGEIPG